MSGVWCEYQDEHGNTYYYNAETEEYVWELPEGATVQADAAADGGGEELEQPSEEQKLSFLKAAIEGKISKLDPEVKKKLDRAKQEQQELSLKRQEAIATGQEDWVEVYDPNSDAFYYYETVSGNVVWEKPESYVMGADNELIAAVIKIQCAYRTRLARQRVQTIRKVQQLIDVNGVHWTEETDEADKTYYLNQDTGESVWERPQEAAPDDEHLSKWFFKKVDGSCFYYNRLTGECVAEKPADFDGDEKQAAPASLSKAFETAVRRKSSQLLLLAKAEEKRTDAEETGENDVWIQVYDPKKQAYYYYSSESKECVWEKPPAFLLAAEDETIRSVIKIQCAYRSRLAKRKVASKRLSAEERLALVEEKAKAAKTSSIKPEAKLSAEEQARLETEERRRMLEQERTQCRRGDRYWGIDKLTQEIIRQRQEEKLMMEAEEYRRFLQDKARRRRDLDRKKMEALSLKQRAEDRLNEERERDTMSESEKAQCFIDRFWGLEKDEADRQEFLRQMAIEDVLSRTYERELLEHLLHQKWSAEAAILLEKKEVEQRAKEKRYQKSYMRTFKHAKSSDFVINYRWPTRTAVAPRKSNKKQQMFHRRYETTIKGYPMDAVYDPTRLTNPINVFHVAESSHTSGRKGKLDIAMTPNSFRLAEPSKDYSLSTSKLLRRVNSEQWQKQYSAMVHPITPPLDNPATLEPGLEKNTTCLSSGNQEQAGPPDTFESEIALLRQVFSLIDLDKSGFINKTEMTWALARDKQVRTLASSSVVLRPILKNREIEALFREMDDDGSDNVSWDEFEKYCQKEFRKWSAKQLERKKSQIEESLRAEQRDSRNRDTLLAQEEAKARHVFALVDSDKSGTIDQNEMMIALKENRQVREFVESSKALQPLLDNSMFKQAFVAMNTDDDDGISVDEFVAFCSEVASIVLLNDM